MSMLFLAVMSGMSPSIFAQNLLQRVDSTLTQNYRKGNIDTAYNVRPTTKWIFTARMNVSGEEIEAEGIEDGHHFKSETKKPLRREA